MLKVYLVDDAVNINGCILDNIKCICANILALFNIWSYSIIKEQ